MSEETGIWDLATAKRRHRTDFFLAAAIAKMFTPKMMVDVGCGVGCYCRIFKGYGWPVIHGYDGTQEADSFGIYDDIMVVDLTKVRYVDIDYDLVLCLEVGEHIPKQYEQVFIDNICRYVGKDLILSWAIPGQGGKGHYNELSNEYVIEEFKKRELKIDEMKTQLLRENASLRWFKNTLMVFERKNG